MSWPDLLAHGNIRDISLEAIKQEKDVSSKIDHARKVLKEIVLQETWQTLKSRSQKTKIREQEDRAQHRELPIQDFERMGQKSHEAIKFESLQ